MPELASTTATASLATEAITPLYEELREVARRIVGGGHDERSLGATGLVHEAVARLMARDRLDVVADPERVLAMAIRTMSNILVDRCRARSRLKRGGGWSRIPLDDVLDVFEGRRIDYIAVHEALGRLEARNPRLGRLVALRYLVGMTNQEIAAARGVTTGAVEKGLQAARAWLRRELDGLVAAG